VQPQKGEAIKMNEKDYYLDIAREAARTPGTATVQVEWRLNDERDMLNPVKDRTATYCVDKLPLSFGDSVIEMVALYLRGHFLIGEQLPGIGIPFPFEKWRSDNGLPPLEAQLHLMPGWRWEADGLFACIKVEPTKRA
jgi:hypothetical protein